MKYSILFALLLITSEQTSAQPKQVAPSQPKLVVGIVVDQMRPDYLQRFQNKFGTDGFRKLLKEGYYCRNTQYNYIPTYTGPGHASIYTGTTPAVHGIVANDWFDTKANDTVYCALDTSVRSVGGADYTGRMSPSRLRSSTITDELRLSTLKKAKVIGISLKDRGSILPAGRSANAAFWFDGISGNWITSTWYMNDLPEWVKDFNSRKWPDEYLSKQWTTLSSIDSYTESSEDDSPYESPYNGESKPVFPHKLSELRGSNFDLVRRVPFGNTMTKDMALAAIKGENLGADNITDFLCISFSSTDYVGHQFGPLSIELEDTYLRLDRDLADLIQFLDNTVGKGKYLMFLTADHAAAYNTQYLKDQKMSAGYSNDAAVADAIRQFLQMKYGKTNYYRCILNDQVYLNTDSVLADKMDVCDVENSVAQYLRTKIDGVLDIVTGCNLQANEYSELFRSKMQKGYQYGRTGDIWILYSPGYMDNYYGGKGTTHGTPYPYDSQVPLIWYGWNIPPGNTTREIHITDIAPTLSFMLNIGIPNGCIGTPIKELVR